MGTETVSRILQKFFEENKTKNKRKGKKSTCWASATPISINNQGSILLEWKFLREKVDCFPRASVMLIESLDSIVTLMIHW